MPQVFRRYCNAVMSRRRAYWYRCRLDAVRVLIRDWGKTEKDQCRTDGNNRRGEKEKVTVSHTQRESRQAAAITKVRQTQTSTVFHTHAQTSDLRAIKVSIFTRLLNLLH